MSLNAMVGVCKMCIWATPCDRTKVLAHQPRICWQATAHSLFQPPNVVQMRTKSNLFELCRVQPTFVKQNNDDLILAIQSAGENVEETAFAKTSPQRRILNRRRTCWSIVPMELMLLIRCILGVRSFRSMIFMADLWVV